ncbi:MAG: head-tail adaptor protein [Pseudomonadota bacterium]
MNRKLVLESRALAQDGAGGATQSWQPLGTLWAEVSARSGRARGDGDGLLGQVSYRIVVRNAPVGNTARPVAGQRFREGARVYRISAVSEQDTTGRYLTCFAQEEVSA